MGPRNFSGATVGPATFKVPVVQGTTVALGSPFGSGQVPIIKGVQPHEGPGRVRPPGGVPVIQRAHPLNRLRDSDGSDHLGNPGHAKGRG